MSKKISSEHASSQWTPDLAERHSPNWNLGIEIIKNRFKKRFFNPIRTLIENPTTEIRVNSGFLIMSIDSLLIETLNQFYLGLKETTDKYYWKNNPDPNCVANWQAFRDFFKHSHFFPDFKDNDVLTKLFFEEIRCGLLHQAESKANSLINIKNSKVVEPLQEGIIQKELL